MVCHALSSSGAASYGSASQDPESVQLIKSTQSTPPRRLGQWYINMFMINFLEFATESSRGIVLPTLFLYTSSLGGDLAFMGFINALFSVGRLFSSTVFGWMCDRYSFRSVYLISTFICLAGNIIYLVADEHLTGSLTALAFSRFIVGFGGGNRSVCRADVASVTTINQRLPYLTILVGVVFLGYALTPGLGSLVADTDLIICGVHLNKFTSPGMILIILNVLTIFGIMTVYDDSVTVHDGPGGRGTVNVPLFITATDSDPESVSVVMAASNFQFYLGLLGLLSYFSIEYFRHSVRDENWVHLGFGMVLAGNILLAMVPENLTFTQLSLAEFLVWSVGCPISTTVVLAAFSKLLGGRPQGTLMGLLGSTACISRSILPLLPAVMPTLEPVFWINIVLCASSIVLLWWYTGLVHRTKMAMLADVENAYRVESPTNDPRSPLGSDKADFPEND
ncbi:Major Facilitator Superfamily (MFS) [Phytophthora infestans T30-4]|uniref:Major Facilitator Superfamily (MFS) n=1 Tax=Phytophthora infestans (strain T30-4) TaxID=403677 RepID=D0N783_PHYIT|nr:Major Facilitator Superfamily (MFS) [Phytophthora infestans T30-4]EEY53432.1 Major Facilitator Superfamily (MFS) [Phytophthora infestans T30-4]|eukprot:XP_002905050.1 Major Facilitator Superfamily (MFS) [Phytophthora infestans T30-4]